MYVWVNSTTWYYFLLLKFCIYEKLNAEITGIINIKSLDDNNCKVCY